MSQPVLATQGPIAIRHPIADGCPPPWASGWGQDQYGIFAQFSLPAEDRDWVTQRLRWIPPGSFQMGAENEPGRDDDEGPVHTVQLTRSFWLFDTPCTQALWMRVMGEEKNPSRFVDPQRPVENVTWDETQEFMERIHMLIPGLQLRLPTEAEWEFGCRAGVTEATYAGPIEILGENNAPILDHIAWYGGNSGVDYDLEEHHDSSGWAQKQYDHTRAGTRKVALKRPNAWGLYDMLGNVWEWCQDWYAGYSADPQYDPCGPPEGRYRVLRGGSWFGDARLVRSAYRIPAHPGSRDAYVGFRCAAVQAD